MQLREFDEQRVALDKQIEARRTELLNEAAGVETQIAGLEATIAAARPEAYAKVQAEILALGSVEAERDLAQDTLRLLSEERASLQATNKALRVEMDALKERINRLQAAEGAECPLCGQPLDEAHRASLVADLTGEGKGHGDTFRANLSRIEQIALDVSAHETIIKEGGSRLKQLQTLREQAGQLGAGVMAGEAARLQLEDVTPRLETLRATLEAGDFAGGFTDTS
ncbi:MAG: hypothetical protein HC828_13440 [Blastochloris sp.]|nr:hypothetical protein [Blastochloris sp.]